jgi:predicted outer membrane protein
MDAILGLLKLSQSITQNEINAIDSLRAMWTATSVEVEAAKILTEIKENEKVKENSNTK